MLKDARLKPAICAVITSAETDINPNVLAGAKYVELRIDLIGQNWQKVAAKLDIDWIATNRRREEGGSWRGNESGRVKELLSAVELGATIVDIELATPRLNEIIPVIKKRAACLVSYHDFNQTPSCSELREIVERQIEAGADICKLVTTARNFKDNIMLLDLIREFKSKKITAFAMGEEGILSRILCPLYGSVFTYASISSGSESAPGQITLKQLNEIYGNIKL